MMSLPVYPSDDLDRGTQLLVQLGSFWAQIFEDRERLRTHLQSSAHEQGQSYLGFLETVACISRLTVPVFHADEWHLLAIRRSAADATASIYRSDDLQFGPQDGSVPGRPAGFVQTYAGTDKPGQVQFVMPEHLVNAQFQIQNAVVKPSVVLVRDIDYDIDPDRPVLRFRDDPFANALIPKRIVFDEAGNAVDEEISLWVYRGQFDLDYVWIQFGYALGLRLKSSESHKELLNAHWDSILLGASVKLVRAVLSALAGDPTIIETTETVEVVRAESDSWLIVTDSRVYRVPLAANLLVAAGDVLYAGAPLTDAIRIFELTGANASLDVLPAMSFSGSMLSGGYFSELIFRNHTVALEYLGLDEQGKAVVRFETSGFPADVDRFWSAAQARGIAAGGTLAELLDTRTNPVGQPGPSNLPATVNPMQFVLGNLLSNNLFVIRVRQASFAKDAPGVSFFRLLRSVVPPHTTYVALIELEPAVDAIDLSVPGGEDEPGAEDAAAVFHGAGPVTDDAYEKGSSPGGTLDYEEVGVSAKLVSLTCV